MDKETADYIEDVRSESFADGRRQGAEEMRRAIQESIFNTRLAAAPQIEIVERILKRINALPLPPEDSNE